MSSTGRQKEGSPGIDPLGPYDTPSALAEAIVTWAAQQVELEGKPLLEPHAGSGAFVDALYGYAATLEEARRPVIEAMDLDPWAPGMSPRRDRGHLVTACRPAQIFTAAELAQRERSGKLTKAQAAALDYTMPDPINCGFLITPPQRSPFAAFGNPPFSVAVPWRAKLPLHVAHLHVLRAMAVADHAFFVLRAGFLASEERRALFELGILRAALVIRPRPAFDWLAQAQTTGRRSTDSADYALFHFDRNWGRQSWAGGWLDWSGEYPE